jgi:hypothetical protein
VGQANKENTTVALTVEQAEQIVEYLEDMDIDANVRAEYSGRGMYMYGSTCVGIVVGDVVAVGYAAGALGIDWDDVPHRTDNMGLSTIVY